MDKQAKLRSIFERIEASKKFYAEPDKGNLAFEDSAVRLEGWMAKDPAQWNGGGLHDGVSRDMSPGRGEEPELG